MTKIKTNLSELKKVIKEAIYSNDEDPNVEMYNNQIADEYSGNLETFSITFKNVIETTVEVQAKDKKQAAKFFQKNYDDGQYAEEQLEQWNVIDTSWKFDN